MYIYIYIFAGVFPAFPAHNFQRDIMSNPHLPSCVFPRGAAARAAQRGPAAAPGDAGRDADLGPAEVQGQGLAEPRRCPWVDLTWFLLGPLGRPQK